MAREATLDFAYRMALVVSANVSRRQMTKYQQAMARAVALAEDGKRAGGKWANGSMNEEESYSFRQYLKLCGAVLDYDAERGTTFADDVLTGALMLQAQGRRRNGRWERGSLDVEITSNAHLKQSLARCGAVLDYDADRTATAVVTCSKRWEYGSVANDGESPSLDKKSLAPGGPGFVPAPPQHAAPKKPDSVLLQAVTQ